MHIFVYTPFVLALVVVALSRTGVGRLSPRPGAWALTVTAVALGVSTVGALMLLAFPLAARIPLVAELGQWQAHSVAQRTPVPVWLSTVAMVAVAWLGWRAVRELHRLGRECHEVVCAQARLAECGSGEVIVIDEAVPRAHAVSRTITRQGRVVVTSAMLDLLDDEERAAVVAHERAHLRHGHGAFLAVMRMSSALSPLLAPMRRDLDFALERWADEDAARATHRAVIASALAKAAIATIHTVAARGSLAAIHLHTHAVTERVTALLDGRALRSRLAWVFPVLATVAAASLLWAMRDTELLFEAVRAWPR